MSEITLKITLPADLEALIQQVFANIQPAGATPAMPPPAEDEIWTVGDLAEALKIPKTKIYDLTMRKGRTAIPRFKVGRGLRFKKTEVLEWFDKQRIV